MSFGSIFHHFHIFKYKLASESNMSAYNFQGVTDMAANSWCFILTMWNGILNFTAHVLFEPKYRVQGLFNLLEPFKTVVLNWIKDFWKFEKRTHFSEFKYSKLLQNFKYDIQFDNISSETIWYSDRLGELFIQRLILSVSEPPKISTGGDSGVTLAMVLPN